MAEIVNDETLQMYVEESHEHLESIESDLLVIEEQGADIDEELVNKVFRAAHSIKGGSGFLGLETIKDLSHKIENVLDLVRNSKLVPSPEVINVVLKAFDHLGVLLSDVLNSNEMEIADHVKALSQLTSSNLAPEEQATLENMLSITHPDLSVQFNVTEFDLQQCRQGGKGIYILAYDLIKDIQHQKKMPMDVIKNLEETGRIVEIILSLEEVGDLDSIELPPVFPMYVLFATIIEMDLMGVVMGLPDSSIFLLNEDELSKTPAKIVEPTPPEITTPTTEPAPTIELPPDPPSAQTVPAPPKPLKKKRPTTVQQESIRVQVQVLDQLMNRAGELVLARNQLLQTITTGNEQLIIQAGQRIDLVTSELQEIIMLTRMQPVANIFSKFPRVVRDMASQLDKEMTLDLQGKEVELDKTIIEGLADPLTHLVRNSADHGIEPPDQREKVGKSRNGTITLRAFHESGQVLIEIEDDGKGLDPEILMNKALEKQLITPEQAEDMSDKEKVNLIMMAGFSTAEKITDVSGRGVGMDVVKTNLDKMGGAVEIISELGKGTIIRIKLPLTLAIIPSLLVTSCGEHFAMPQVNVRELLRISAKDAREAVEHIGGAEVLILRGELIPLMYLNDILDLYPLFTDLKTGEKRTDRRNGVMDKRLSPHESATEDETVLDNNSKQPVNNPNERRFNRDSDIMIVVVQAGSFKYGLVVDQLHDTVEIVVKPLGRHLKHCKVFAGATIMGDGHVALILDVAGLANAAELQSLTDTEQQTNRQKSDMAKLAGRTRQTLLLFHNGSDEQCGVPLQLVQRIEQISQNEIEIKGGHKVMQYRGGTLPVYALEEVANVEMLEATEQLNVIVFVVAGRNFGLLAAQPLDIQETDLIIDEQTLRQPGVAGSAIINNQTTLLIDIYGMMESLNPDWFDKDEEAVVSNATTTILLAEDSNFFLAQVKQFVEESGYKVIGAEDGQVAWDILEERGDEISLVLTDIEMPVMNGFELTSKIKSDQRFSHLPVIALTSLAGEEDVARGKEVGIDEYQVKLDKEKLLGGIQNLLPA